MAKKSSSFELQPMLPQPVPDGPPDRGAEKAIVERFKQFTCNNEASNVYETRGPSFALSIIEAKF